ncbi:inner membrane protein YiaB [Citrobacter sp. Igbk 17]|uniref:inner membrane protein YiaB n=1 Tax=Citrobacter sp. Igbk 17 TaxID=2963957 RepID=UPI002304A410|nr:inner membrane protein YiaB [Citrobacter sp. Igbk 17]MDA8496808.1 inner membrane protein YiaB [Citrobacter sp. Igbk 17]
MKTTRLLPWLLFLSGALIYCAGLWWSCPLLSGKGYFLGVLMTGLFVTYAYLRAENRNQSDERFAFVCQMVALITVGLLLVGVWNAPLAPLEMGLYPAAFCVCISGLILLMYPTEKAHSDEF